MAKEPNAIRIKLNAILTLARTDQEFRTLLAQAPEKALAIFGLSSKQIADVSTAWGIGAHRDCGKGTCRTTSPCGWTICGQTTNRCGGVPEWGTIKINPPEELDPARVLDKRAGSGRAARRTRQ
jgi:hypothetical protein